MLSYWQTKYQDHCSKMPNDNASSAHRHILLKLPAHQHRPVAPIMLLEDSRVYLTFQVRDILLLTIGEKKENIKSLLSHCSCLNSTVRVNSFAKYSKKNKNTKYLLYCQFYANLHCKPCM